MPFEGNVVQLAIQCHYVSGRQQEPLAQSEGPYLRSRSVNTAETLRRGRHGARLFNYATLFVTKDHSAKDHDADYRQTFRLARLYAAHSDSVG